MSNGCDVTPNSDPTILSVVGVQTMSKGEKTLALSMIQAARQTAVKDQFAALVVALMRCEALSSR